MLVHAALSNDLPRRFSSGSSTRRASARRHQLGRRARHRAAHAGDGRAPARQSVRPAQAIPASARLLRDHYRRFGNLGLAAAAYNAGPRRVDDWRAKKGALPQETQDYVKAITGFPVETWTVAFAGGPAVKLPQGAPCQEAAGLLAWDGPDEIPMPTPNPRLKELAEAKAAAAAAARREAKKNAKAADTKSKKRARTAEKPETKRRA
jgi:hypothetical protein